MNRSPRHPPRIQPPLRGRSAAAPSLGKDQTPMVIARQRPPISSSHTTIVKIVEKSTCDDLHPDWIALYQRWPKLLKVLNRPWKWLLVSAVLVILSIMIGRLL